MQVPEPELGCVPPSTWKPLPDRLGPALRSCSAGRWPALGAETRTGLAVQLRSSSGTALEKTQNRRLCPHFIPAPQTQCTVGGGHHIPARDAFLRACPGFPNGSVLCVPKACAWYADGTRKGGCAPLVRTDWPIKLGDRCQSSVTPSCHIESSGFDLVLVLV